MAGNTRKPAVKRKKPADTKTTQHARKQMWAVVLFACGILIGALTLIEGDKLWEVFHRFLFGMFGWSVYFFAPLMIYISVIAALDRPLSTIQNKLWQLIALVILISGAIQIFGSGMPDEGGFIEDLKSLYNQGIDRVGGGVLSMLVAMPLIGLFEKTGASIIIILCIAVFAMLVTGSTLISLFRALTRPVKSMEDAYTASVEDREARRRERESREPTPKKTSARAAAKEAAPPAKSPRFDIDVDISNDTVVDEDDGLTPWDDEPEKPDLPEHPVVSSKSAPQPPRVTRTGAKPSGAESLVEYISPEEFTKRPPLESVPEIPEDPEPVRRHSLDEDILRAEQETGDEIGNVIDRFISSGLESQYLAPDDEIAILTEDPPEPDYSGQHDDFDIPIFNEPADFVSAAQVFPAIPAAPLEDFSPDAPVVSEPPIHIYRPTQPEDAAPEPLREFVPEQQAQTLVPIATIPAFGDMPDGVSLPSFYAKPSISLLNVAKAANSEDVTDELKNNAQTLVDTLKSFGVQTRITDICRGPAVTRYELQPSAGVKISKITGLSDDIALNLASAGIRIEAPIPNKAAVGIEVPNKVVSMVSIREILDSHEFASAESSVSVALGKDIAGNITLADIGKMPHLLIAGSTGSGKSVCINSIIISLLYRSSPEDVKLLLVDPKVVELGVYNGIPHLLVPVVTDPQKAAGALNWAVVEMLRRYKEFADHSVRDLAGYNRLAQNSDELKPMPKIVIIIDELADLMMAAPNVVEDSICRLAQMARAAGMHLVIATQRPSVDVITGVIKANIPSRIAFAVSSMVDSRTILDMGGAEKLLGRGDMLFYPVGASKPQRVQGCFVTDLEVEKVVEFIKAGEATEYDQQIVDEIDRHVVPDKSSSKDGGGGFDDDDEMLPQAIECVVEAGMASTSQLQRRLKLGYARAARIIDQLEERGIVGPFEGSKPRQVLISKERWIEMKLSGGDNL